MTTSDLDNLMQVPRFVRRYPDLTSNNHIRWLIFKRETNGLAASGALIKRAGRWYIDVPQFRQWLVTSDE